MNLSNQAKWYLRGHWPVRTGIIGHSNPEPKAMQELVDNFLAVEAKDTFTKEKIWFITKLGVEVKEQK